MLVPRLVEPTVIVTSVMSTVFGSQTSAGFVMFNTGVGFTVTITAAVSVQLLTVVFTMKKVPSPTAVGSATAFVAAAFAK